MIKNIPLKALILLACTALILESCVTGTPPPPPVAPVGVPVKTSPAQSDPAQNPSAKLSSIPPGVFTTSLLSTIRSDKLSNGIPVIVQRMRGMTVACIRILWRADSVIDPGYDARIEASMLEAMKKSSVTYQGGTVTEKLHASSAAMEWSIEPDSSWIQLAAPVKYLPGLLDILIAAATRTDFSQVSPIMDAQGNRRAVDGLERAKYAALLKAYQDHPYRARFSPLSGSSDESPPLNAGIAPSVTSLLFSADRMTVIASGDIDPDDFVATLNTKLKTLSRVEKPSGPVARASWRSELVTVVHPASNGNAWIYGAFAAPPADSTDFAAMKLALLMLDDLLFDQLRTRQSLCYGTWTELEPHAVPWVGIAVYASPDPVRAKRSVDGAIAELASGQALGRSRDAKSRIPIEKAIAAYRLKATTEYYEGLLSASGVIETMAESGSDDPLNLYHLIDAIALVTPADITRVVKTYLFDKPCIWSVAADSAVIDTISTVDFSAFNPITD